MRRITQKDIAEALELEVTTVSKALQGHPGIAAATRERVRETAEALGYRPDPMLSALAAYRDSRRAPGYRATLAWLCNHPAGRDMGIHAGYDDYLRGGREAARALGYALDVFHNPRGPEDVGGVLRVLRARGIPGLVLAPQARPGVELTDDFAGLSAVTIGFTLRSPRLHLVTNDHFGTMLSILEKAEAMGRRHPACLLYEMDNHRMGRRMAGALEALGQERKMPMLQLRRRDKAATLAWLQAHPEVDVVISREPRLTVWLREARRKTNVIHYALDSPEEPGPGMYHNNVEIGRAAVEMLAGLVRRGDRGIPALPRRLMLESTWVDSNESPRTG